MIKGNQEGRKKKLKIFVKDVGNFPLAMCNWKATGKIEGIRTKE